MARGFKDDGSDHPYAPDSDVPWGRGSKKQDAYYEFHGEVVASSEKAWKFKSDTWDKAEWLPKSQCQVVDMDEHEHRATIKIKQWLCEKNGWSEI
jgi:hypothetical protein